MGFWYIQFVRMVTTSTSIQGIFPHQRSVFIRGTHQLIPELFLCYMPCLINIKFEAWTIFSFQKSSCRRCTQKKSKTMEHGVCQQEIHGITNLLFKEDYTKDRKKMITWEGRQRLLFWRGGWVSLLVLWRSVCMTLIRFIFVYGGWEVGVEHQWKLYLWKGN